MIKKEKEIMVPLLALQQKLASHLPKISKKGKIDPEDERIANILLDIYNWTKKEYGDKL